MSRLNRNTLELFTGGHGFDPHTYHSYYYYTTDHNKSLSSDKSNATVGLSLIIIESKILYQLKVRPGGLDGWLMLGIPNIYEALSLGPNNSTKLLGSC